MNKELELYLVEIINWLNEDDFKPDVQKFFGQLKRAIRSSV